MLKKTVEILFQRHGIPVDDIDKANEIIEFLLFDNPSIVYPESKQHGIYDIDWENEIMYIREHRTDVMFDDLDRSEICLEFENIQRIAFKINANDYKEGLDPGTSEAKVKEKLEAFNITKEYYDTELINELNINYRQNIINLAKSLSITKLQSRYEEQLLSKTEIILTDISDYIKTISQSAYERCVKGLNKAKALVLSELKSVPINEEQIEYTLNNTVKLAIDRNTLDTLYIANKGISIDKFIVTELTKEINRILANEKHELYLLSEVKLGVVVEDKANINSEVILRKDGSSNINSEVLLMKTGESNIDSETSLIFNGQRYVNAEMQLTGPDESV